MRKNLKKINNQRKQFFGIFKRFGEKTGYKGYPEVTVLLIDVRDDNDNLITEHIWFNYTKGFQKLGHLRDGDLVSFQARSKQYWKGYVNWREDIDESELDYKLNYPTKIELVKEALPA